jgi:hypothetical protein
MNSSVIGRLGLDSPPGPFALSPNKCVVRRDYCLPLVSLVFSTCGPQMAREKEGEKAS